MPGRVAVSGGAGFIGSHVVERLVAAGWRVLVVDDLSHAADTVLPGEADVVVADCGSSTATTALRRFQPEVILHLAARGGVPAAARRPSGHLQEVVGSSVAFWEAARSAGARRVVTASSGGALYGDARVRPTAETAACRPRSAYGASKLAEEVYLGALGRTWGISTLALRFANVYGPRQDGMGESGLVAITCRRLLAGSAPLVRGDGGQTRDFVFVADVADAALRAVGAEAEGALNIGTGRETSVTEVVAGLQAAAGSRAEVERVDEVPGEVRHGCLRADRARRALGWGARTPLSRGLEQTYAWFAEHPVTEPADDRIRANA